MQQIQAHGMVCYVATRHDIVTRYPEQITEPVLRVKAGSHFTLAPPLPRGEEARQMIIIRTHLPNAATSRSHGVSRVPCVWAHVAGIDAGCQALNTPRLPINCHPFKGEIA
jgi:hypothetical protein